MRPRPRRALWTNHRLPRPIRPPAPLPRQPGAMACPTRAKRDRAADRCRADRDQRLLRPVGDGAGNLRSEERRVGKEGVSVDIGGSRLIKKKKRTEDTTPTK